MVAFGNPPYSGHSSNNGEWVQNLIEAYKREPGGGKLQEKNSKWLNDDYVKFIRLGEYYIEKNGEGVLAYITNHSYMDNPTFRGMRWHLLNTFDDIYILDLHGNAKKKETSPDGSVDKNIFDIQQGVSIIIAIKKNKEKKKPLAKVHHADLWGSREKKYELLRDGLIKKMKFSSLIPSAPFFMLVPRDEGLLLEYNSMPSLPEILKVNVMGFQTHRDDFAVGFENREIEDRFTEFRDKDISDNQLEEKYKIKDNRDWKITAARQALQNDPDWKRKIISCSYRPFDSRSCYFSYVAMDYPRREMLDHVAWKNNLCLGVGKQGMAVPERPWELAYVSRGPMDANIYRRGGVNVFPLYLYYSEMGVAETRTPNLDPKIYAQIKKIVPDVTPEALFDYIYSVLHSPSYRQRYAEFLKSDFPRIPYPKDKKTFHTLAGKGAELRDLHLMESPALDKPITTYPVDGDHEVIKPRYEGGKVWINITQYFGNVPEVAWSFFIGGYQPAQKWLKDRRGRNLSIDDIRHYQRIIVALTETDRIMKEIDEIDFLSQKS